MEEIQRNSTWVNTRKYTSKLRWLSASPNSNTRHYRHYAKAHFLLMYLSGQYPASIRHLRWDINEKKQIGINTMMGKAFAKIDTGES